MVFLRCVFVLGRKTRGGRRSFFLKQLRNVTRLGPVSEVIGHTSIGTGVDVIVDVVVNVVGDGDGDGSFRQAEILP